MSCSYPLTGRLASHYLRLGEQEIHYLRSTGPDPRSETPVVLIHGIMAGSSFRLVGELIAPYHRVYIPDMPGVGQSADPPHPPELSDMVENLINWMDKCGLERAHFAAQSFGCNLAVEAATRYPDRFASLTLQALTLEPARRSPLRLAPHWLLAELRETPKGKTKKEGQRGVSAQGSRALVKALFGHRIEERLPLVQCPTLILHGSHDLIVSRQWVETAAQLVPDCRLQVVHGATHTMNARQPDTYFEAFQSFIDSLSFNVDIPTFFSGKGDTHAT